MKVEADSFIVKGGSQVTDFGVPLGGRFVARAPIPDAYDFSSFTVDSAYHDLDLSALVPAGAKAVLLRVDGAWTTAGHYFIFRPNGDAGTYGPAMMNLVGGATQTELITVGCDANRVIEYTIHATNFTSAGIVVLGWWL